ncbi:class I SAM-dependent methyltransferase [Clostridium estertheticum]|uniref:Class I SAM-dependent methyltransferase n=1 Tax=Clostridium estertheticum TaxID=238834 RepID=A0AA47I9I6_9CLOT|nr:class I SAM-dependent methyltransferase [Clostridium estertheticum]MBU3157627.1 class I SAM-dependent methyltransferase [Clostridium estertheticum]WAG63245.1 class I SAM-dependent methyltransferase [Clostridium estertheticum]
MKNGKYGLDAPTVVIGYISVGILSLILGITLSSKFYYASWMINLGIVFLLIGLYMVYSSKVGKYKMRSKIIQRLSIKGNEMTLDVGCGRGLLLNGVASQLNTGKAYGIDIWNANDQSGNSYDAVMWNAKIEGTESKIKVINSDMRKMPFQDGYFDIIVSSLAIHNLQNNEERKKALLEIARVAKKSCKLAILDIAHIEYYVSILSNQGFDIEHIDKHQFQIFPPVKVLYAIKK